MPKTSSVSRSGGAPASGSPGGEVRAGSPVSVGGIVAGKYRIGAVVGFTGMGIACAGVHLDLGTKVVVLFAHPEDASDERAVARFLQGARSAAQLRSPHARRVMDCGRLGAGEPYMVLESLEGADLRSIVTTHGSLPVEETLSFVLQACEALGEAHARGLVHGDVRPENLFLTRAADGSALVKVLGLEFATELSGPRESRPLSESLDGVGSIRHLSPEQMSDAPSVDTRADIWSLGVLLYELLTGVFPFEGDSASKVRDSVMSEQPRSPRDFDPAISKGLGEVVLRCLEKNPETRFPDAATLAGALRAFGGSASSMGAARVEDVLRYARSIRPARDASPSIPAPRPTASAPPLSRSSAGSSPASEQWDSEEEDSEEDVRTSWLMDPPESGLEPAPAAPRAIATTPLAVATKPPPIPASTPSAAVTSPHAAVSKPPPMPLPLATTTPPPMPAMPAVTTTPPKLPGAARVAAGMTLPPLPPSVKELAAVAAAWVVKNRLPVIAGGGAVVLALIIVLVSRANPGPAAEPSAATSAVAPIRPVAPPAALSAVEMAPSPVSAPSARPAPAAVAPPRKPARTAAPTASSRPKRARPSNAYPVLKPPNL